MASLSLQHRPRVALLVESSIAYGREIQEGIADYVQTHGQWSIFVEPHELSSSPPVWLKRQKWDGIITRVVTPDLVRIFQRLKIPVVNLNDRQSVKGVPCIRSDDQAIGALAARHLIERGFRNFAFCGFTEECWAEQRRIGFESELRTMGWHSSFYESYWTGPKAIPWDTDEEKLAGWLKTLSRPLGIVACNDNRGQHVLEACRRAGIRVPAEAAVIGVDNDVHLCRLCDPPLSTVVPNARLVGFSAAELLDRLMQGETAQAETTLIPPAGIITRQSSEILAIDDEDVAAAIQFIRQNACHGIHVTDVLKQVPLSRTLLERKFRQHIGMTPHLAIRQVQLQRARELLTETELPLKQVSELSGFSHTEYLSYYFFQSTGMRPGAYRRTHGKRLRGTEHFLEKRSLSNERPGKHHRKPQIT